MKIVKSLNGSDGLSTVSQLSTRISKKSMQIYINKTIGQILRAWSL